MGRTTGPFATPPFTNFQVSPISLVPKKHTGKFCTIFHLSFPKSGDSINSFIDEDNLSLQYVTTEGKAALWLKQTSRQLFLSTQCILMTGNSSECTGGVKYYFDKVLPSGLRNAPFVLNTLSDALEKIALVELLITFVDHILDDFIIGEATEAECSISLQ